MTITTGDFDAGKYPIPPLRIVPSATKCVHTPTPTLYHPWHEWCEQASKMHRQIRCPHCGLFAVWLPKAEARAINRQDEKDAKEFCRLEQRSRLEEEVKKLQKTLREK